MGATAQALGMGTTIEYAGNVWKMSPWTFGVMGDYELYLQQETLADLRRLWSVTGFDPMEAKLLRREFMEMVAAKEFTFGSELVFKSMFADKNMAYLLYLCLVEGNKNTPLADMVHPNLATEMVKEIFGEVQAAMQVANPRFFKKPATGPTPPSIPTPSSTS